MWEGLPACPRSVTDAWRRAVHMAAPLSPLSCQPPVPDQTRRLIRRHFDLILIEPNIERVVVDIRDKVHVQQKLVIANPFSCRPGRHVKWAVRAEAVHSVQANRETQGLPIVLEIHPCLTVLRKRQRQTVEAG